MRTSSISFRDVIGSSYRFDPSYHLSEATQVRSILNSLPYGTTDVASSADRVFIGNIFSRVFVKDSTHGVPYLAASDTVLANLDTGFFLSKKQASVLSNLMLQKDWILVTCSGTLGNVTYTNRYFENRIATHDLIRIIPNDRVILRGCLFAFLSSKYGYYQLTQSQFGGVVKHINADHARSIIVPIFPKGFQNSVDALVKESANLRDKAVDKLQEAIQYFEEKYSVTPMEKFFSRGIHDMRLGWAAYNNNTQIDEIESQYISDSFVIGDQTDRVFAPPLFKHIYLSNDNGYPFMTGSELTRFNLRYYRWLSPRGVKDIRDYVVKEGTLLLYKSGTTDGGILGNVFIADKALDGCCLSDHVIRIQFKDKKLAYWSFAFLRTSFGVKLLQALATGTMIPFITPDRVANLSIPKPDNHYEEIVRIVSEYISLNSESKTKENEAVSMIEKEIEKWNS